jgi:hypothetical protein
VAGVNTKANRMKMKRTAGICQRNIVKESDFVEKRIRPRMPFYV